MRINGHYVDVDIAEELEMYTDEFKRMRIRGNKLQACSPFRHENHPSFAVNLENGTWIDSGASDESERKGNFISLLAFFRNESYEETAEYLLDKYSTLLNEVDGLKLKINLGVEEKREFNADVVLNEAYPVSEYLDKRGVDFGVQKVFNVKQINNAVAMAWHDKTGKIINVKYRDTRTKKFWYEDGGELISNHIYGLWLIRKQNIKRVWAVESEIDCLYLWSLNIPAIAFGHGAITDKQKTLLINSGIEELVIATDNDTVGHRFAEVLIDEFAGWFSLYRLSFPENVKDVNEMSIEQIEEATSRLRSTVPFGFSLK